MWPGVWPNGVLEGVERVLDRALARDPAERYASAGALWYALEDLEAEAQEAKEEQQRAATIAQWRHETEQAIEAQEWTVAGMAVGRWLALEPGGADAQAALERIEQQAELESQAEREVFAPAGPEEEQLPLPQRSMPSPVVERAAGPQIAP